MKNSGKGKISFVFFQGTHEMNGEEYEFRTRSTSSSQK